MRRKYCKEHEARFPRSQAVWQKDNKQGQWSGELRKAVWLSKLQNFSPKNKSFPLLYFSNKRKLLKKTRLSEDLRYRKAPAEERRSKTSLKLMGHYTTILSFLRIISFKSLSHLRLETFSISRSTKYAMTRRRNVPLWRINTSIL